MKKHLAQIVLQYLRFFAKLQLKKNNPIIIGITGSAGKSSACDAAKVVLQKKYLLKTAYKANSESGIPLDILGISPTTFSALDWMRMLLLAPWKLLTNWEKYTAYLVEMGIDSPLPPKNMEYLLTIVKPAIGVVLNAYPTHSETFDFLVTTNDPEERARQIAQLIAIEKGKLITTLPNTGTAITNADQKETAELLTQTKAKKLSFGTTPDATVQITKYSATTTGATFAFKHQTETAKISLPFALPSQYGHTLAAAICVGLASDIPFITCCDELEKNYRLPPGRASLIAGKKGTMLLDSSYNASPEPTIDLLQLLKQLSGGKKCAILGDMRELGIVSKLEHERVALAAAANCDRVLLVGPMMKMYALPILQSSKTTISWHVNAFEAAQVLLTELSEGDIVLIKGSQNTLFLEIAVEHLMARPEDAEKLLARRGAFWDAQRAGAGGAITNKNPPAHLS